MSYDKPTIINLYTHGTIDKRSPVKVDFVAPYRSKKYWWRGEVTQEDLFRVLRRAGLIVRGEESSQSVRWSSK